jgi:hypothetical protein
MNEQTSCEREQAVVKSLRTGFLSEAISAHLESCANCRETAAAVSFFQEALVDESQPKNMPAAGLIWWKSRLREKQKLAERVTQPIMIAQTAAALIACGAFIWLWQMGVFASSAFGIALTRMFSSMEEMGLPLLAGFIFFIIVCATLGFTLRRFMLEE